MESIGAVAATPSRALEAAKDPGAFRLLVEQHSRALFRLAYRMTGNEQDAEDVVQETFLKAHRNLGKFEERAQIGTWLHRIAVNCALDLIRSRQRHARGRVQPPPGETEGGDLVESTATGSPDPERLVMSGEVRGRVASAMKRLSEIERVAFVLRHFEGQGIAQIAGVLGLSEGAAKNTIFRAVSKLRRELETLVAGT
jgi:RNA polymerase sigma-70 factor (ECF subfamily)